MARSRNIKPGFFTNDDLAEIGPLGQLLFAGLWTIADREGRLFDRPRKIKAEILPYYDADCDALLSALATRHFIIRYQVDGAAYIQITNWHKHQNPHYKEGASEIPAPPGHADSQCVTFGVSDEQRQRIMERDGGRCQQCGSTERPTIDHLVPYSQGGTGDDENLQVLCLRCNAAKHNRAASSNVGSTSDHSRTDIGSSSHADSLNLIPDSLNLIPDTGFPHPKTEALQPSVSAAATDDAVPPLPRAAPKPKRRVTEHDAAFHDRFWPAWPRKVAKAEALHAWRTLRPDAATVERILAAIPRQCAALDWPREGYRFCPHPATWLRAHRWEDEVPPLTLGGNGARASPHGAPRGRETLTERNRRAFEEAFGHEPDDVPDAIDAAFRSHEPRALARADPTLVAAIRRPPRRGA